MTPKPSWHKVFVDGGIRSEISPNYEKNHHRDRALAMAFTARLMFSTR